MPTEKTPNDVREIEIARLVTAFEKRLRKDYPGRLLTIEEIERMAQEIGEGVKQDIQQEKSDATGTGYSGKRVSCACGARARYKHTADRQIVTLHGAMLLRRAYYWCDHCKSGWHPVDPVLQVPKGQVSVSVRALACRFASVLPYKKAVRELEIVCGVRLSVSTLQRICRQTGQALRDEWQTRQEQVWSGNFTPKVKAPAQLNISMDGVMAHVGGGWHEVKLGVCFERGKKGPVRSQYCATLARSNVFGKSLKTLSAFAGEPLCRNVAVVADGSDWIWQESGKHFTMHTHILDFFHVTEHLWAFARARFAANVAEATEWIELQKERLLNHDNGAAEMIEDIRKWEPELSNAIEVRRITLAYLLKYQKQMRYKEFASRGLPIGSGVMESSCRWVVQQRMKAPGMRWQTEGAEAMLQLRTAYCSEADADLVAAARRTAIAA
jgi:uncharacterized protein UPF0236